VVNLAAYAGLMVLLRATGVPSEFPDPYQDPPQTVEHPKPLQDARDRIYYPGDTERIIPLTRKLLGNVLLDQKEIWTSPFHMHAKDAKWWIGFGAVTAALIATDHRTSTVFENSQGQVSWGNNISKIGASYTLASLAAGFYGYGVLRDDPKAREVGVLGGEALLDSLIVVQILKPIAGRNRPDAANEKGHFFEGGSSFPSGHAIASWALASVISHEYGRTKIVPIVAIGPRDRCEHRPIRGAAALRLGHRGRWSDGLVHRKLRLQDPHGPRHPQAQPSTAGDCSAVAAEFAHICRRS